MTDYIRRAVELAEGWSVEISQLEDSSEFIVPPSGCVSFDMLSADTPAGSMYRDALAAQLVRQVDATETYYITTRDDSTEVRSCGTINKMQQGPDRTMNTLKCIVDSGVLNE